MKALAYPRWEDYNYEPLDSGVTNRFYWLGDGSTYNEKHMTGDRKFTPRNNLLGSLDHIMIGAWYLNPDEIDYPPGKTVILLIVHRINFKLFSPRSLRQSLFSSS